MRKDWNSKMFIVAIPVTNSKIMHEESEAFQESRNFHVDLKNYGLDLLSP